MTKFLVLFRSSMSANEQMANMTPETGEAAMQAWMKWFEENGEAVVAQGSPLGDSTVVNGTPGNGGHFGGYSLVQAESADVARKMFEDHPHLEAPDPSIEIIEILPQPGM